MRRAKAPRPGVAPRAIPPSLASATQPMQPERESPARRRGIRSPELPRSEARPRPTAVPAPGGFWRSRRSPTSTTAAPRNTRLLQNRGFRACHTPACVGWETLPGATRGLAGDRARRTAATRSVLRTWSPARRRAPASLRRRGRARYTRRPVPGGAPEGASQNSGLRPREQKWKRRLPRRGPASLPVEPRSP